MASITDQAPLIRLGARLLAERLARNEPQARFAARLGVSVSTLRRMEQGDPTAQIGHWLAALERLDHQADRLTPPLMAIKDALPDARGRRLLILRGNLPRREQGEPHLFRALAGRGLGALGFFPPGDIPEEEGADADLVDLDTLAKAAADLEAGHEIDDRLRLLLAAGSSPGGRRPKALVREGERYWIAKFASRRDEVDELGLGYSAFGQARGRSLQGSSCKAGPGEAQAKT